MGGHRRDTESGSGSSDSGSSKGSPSRSPSPETAPTPGFSLEHHDPRSPRSPSGSPHSKGSGSNASRSGSPQSNKSRSRRSRSATPKSRRRSGSHQSEGSRHSRNKSISPSSNRENPEGLDSRSQSPNLQIDDQAGSDRSRSHSSRSRSKSPSRPRSRGASKSRSRSKSRSSRSRSGTPGSRARSHSSRSRSGTPASRATKSKSRSRSRSGGSRRSRSKSRSSRSRSRSRSSSNGTRSGSGSDIVKRKKRKTVSSGSESGGSIKDLKKRKRAEQSDSDAENKKEVTADALFGDADDISTDDEERKAGGEKRKSKSQSRSRSRSAEKTSPGGTTRSRTPERGNDIRMEDAEDRDDDAEPIPETRIEVEIPRIVTDLGKDIHFVKLPNFLSVETRPFDPETYEDEIDEEETMDEEGRQRIKLKVSNTIRWREYMDKKGNVTKDSNARMVKWSDGSMSLHLGNEIFDVYRQPLQGDHNHLFIRQGTGLQGQAVFRTKLTFRPHSTESFTHKKMTMSLADRSQKTSGIKILTQVGKDPTADRQYYLKKEEEKLRQAMRKQHQIKPKRSRGGDRNAGDSHAGGANSSYRDHDEGSDDDNGISLNAIKNKYKKPEAKQGAAIYSSDDDDSSDFEARRSKKTDKTRVLRALKDSDSESNEQLDDKEEGGDGDETEHNGSDAAGGDDSDE